MTDPFQPVDPQTQTPATSQTQTDDILWGEDIFATIPSSLSEEEMVEGEDDLPYGDILEKKYQFQPIPEIETPVVQESIQTPQPAPQPQVQPATQSSQPTVQQQISQPVQPVVTPVQMHTQPTPVVDNLAQEEMEEIQQQSSLEQSQIENLLDTHLQTDVQKKFGELFSMTKKIYETKQKLWNTEETFDILGANNDKIFISYRFLIDETKDPMLFITKIEQTKDTEEETINELRFAFNQETSSLEVVVNEVTLFDEISDFAEDQKKKMQVMDKLNKFIFLTSEELRKLEKQIKEKEEEEKERRKLQEIFRNF